MFCVVKYIDLVPLAPFAGATEGRPDNGLSNYEDCVVMGPYLKYGWQDVACRSMARFLVPPFVRVTLPGTSLCPFVPLHALFSPMPIITGYFQIAGVVFYIIKILKYWKRC